MLNNSYSLNLLIQRNQEFKERFHCNSLFTLMRSGVFQSKQTRDKFLRHFQVWSEYFQKAMLLKTALCDDAAFKPVFRQHLAEEFGHDQLLTHDHHGESCRKDALLEAICCWFPYKMLTLTRHEQIVAMNLCVEAAAAIFYEYANPVINPGSQCSHFNSHGEIDHLHENLGLSLLEHLTQDHYKRLIEVQEESWEMCEALMHRLGELVHNPQVA